MAINRKGGPEDRNTKMWVGMYLKQTCKTGGAGSFGSAAVHTDREDDGLAGSCDSRMA